MIIMGADYHPGFHQSCICGYRQWRVPGTGRLAHAEEAWRSFYRVLAAGQKVRVGMEASGQARWFERLISELHFQELWIGDAAKIRTKNECANAEAGSAGCAADSAVAAGRSLPEDLGTELRKIETCGNCCSTSTAWCRRARES